MIKFAFCLVSGSLCAQSVQVNFLAQDVIEKRLASFTTKNATREPAIKALFEEAGCTGDALSEQFVKGTKSPNLICTLKGASDSTIVVGAHFDLIEKGQGVVDNWSGSSLLSSLFQGLAESPRKHTFVFIAFTGEEQGTLGSIAYVKKLGDQKARIKAMVNLDTLGLGPPLLWAGHSSGLLGTWMTAIAKQLNIAVDAVNLPKGATTDSEPFFEAKIPAITVHSVYGKAMDLLHSRADKMDAMNLTDYYQTYKLVMAFLAAVDQKLD